MALIPIRVIASQSHGVDLTKALSYITGSHVPQGSTVKVVGIDYDSPQNNSDLATESMYISWFQTNDMLVSAWRNAFAAHLNAREDLNMMEDLGEFEVGWYTSGLHPSSTPGVASNNFDEDVPFDWAPLDTSKGTTRKTTAALGTATGPLGEPDSNYFCYPDLLDSVKVGSFNGDVWDSRFALLGSTITDASSKRATIGIIDAFNKANPVYQDMGTDPFGQANPMNSVKKYGDRRLFNEPMKMKIQPGLSTHFQIPMGGINVMCGIVRLHDGFLDYYADGSSSGGTPDETGNAADTGIITFWIEGWTEF